MYTVCKCQIIDLTHNACVTLPSPAFGRKFCGIWVHSRVRAPLASMATVWADNWSNAFLPISFGFGHTTTEVRFQVVWLLLAVPHIMSIWFFWGATRRPSRLGAHGRCFGPRVHIIFFSAFNLHARSPLPLAPCVHPLLHGAAHTRWIVIGAF